MKPDSIVFCILLLAAACSPVSQQPRPDSTLSVVYGQVPGFSLTERSGRTVTGDDLRGKVWIADFIFTSCAGICPSMTEKMRTMQDTLPGEIHLVSFTVDPDHDTPQALAEYGRRHGADGRRWLFLTGSKDALYRLSIEGFKLGVADTGGTEIEPITHSTRFVLVDRTGQIRGYYGSTEPEEMQRLAEDAKKLL